ncbi:MAG: TolC family protein [Balneolaceae bacterium]|jgi:outer membrane protein TolC
MFAVVLLSILFGSYQPSQPDTLTLDYCYSRIQEHYPIARKIELQDEITSLNKKIINTAYYPQLNFGAAATYQSEVTEFPGGGQIPGPELSKDQYKVTMDVSQSIYDGGAVHIKKELEDALGTQKKQSTKVQLHQLKEQVNQVYFGILLARRQLETTNTLLQTLRAQVKDIKSKVKNGVLLPNQQYILEAELIKSGQDSTQIQSNIKAGFQILGQLIDQDLRTNIPLTLPRSEPNYNMQNSLAKLRPEFGLFESSRKAFSYQKKLAQTNKVPSVSAFGTAAYGRPGFNVFENDLHPYYIVGFRVKWNLWGARNANTKQRMLGLQQKSVTEEEHAFERQLQASLSKIREQIQSLQEQVKRDERIIQLREKVVSVAASQMKNGTSTATEYITELNKETQARMAMMIHKTKLAQAKIDYQTTLGISK